MTQTFKERVRDICYDLSEHQIQGVKEGIVTDFKVEEAIEAICQAARECLVPEHHQSPLGFITDQHDGWNGCRQEILNRIDLEQREEN